MNATLARLIGIALYGLIAIGATPATADLTEAQVDALMEARQGDMKKLVFHKDARPRLEREFMDKRGAGVTVSDFAGKIVVFNFWATWCPPCRKEMPSLDRLEAAMGGDDFQVVALAMDRASVEKLEDFYFSIDAENLKIFRDPTLRIGTEAAVLGMPITLILDRQGKEIARMQGEAEWDGPNAQHLLRMIIEMLDAQS